MEDILQRIFAILVTVIIFFLFPLYIAFEKKDDISYSMALKITSNFVDNVKNKGYLSNDMYLDFVGNLAVTGNDYDIKLEHISKKYYPVIYAYKADGSFDKYDYSLYENDYKENNNEINGIEYETIVLAYDLSSQINTKNQILGFLDAAWETGNDDVDEIFKLDDDTSIYPMSVGDEFTVIVKNSNTTVASILFNTLTFGANNKNTTKIYINYGGTIQGEEYNKVELEEYTPYEDINADE